MHAHRTVLILLFLALCVTSGCNFVSRADISSSLTAEPISTTGTIPNEMQEAASSPDGATHAPTVSTTPQNSPAPSATPQPSPTSSLPTASITPSPTARPTTAAAEPTPVEIPFAAIQILYPGPTSRLVSPFMLKAVVRAEPAGSVLIELLGEDGRLLMREVRNFIGERRQQISLTVEIDYAIAAVAEAGRLQISVVDESNRLVSVASTDLILLSVGRADINPSGDLLENIVIQSPEEKMLIQGGIVRVSGLARLRTSQPLMIELETTDGKIVGTRQVSLTPVPDSTHGTFAIDVTYQVSAPTKARLKIWEPGDRIPGIIYLSSVEILLGP